MTTSADVVLFVHHANDMYGADIGLLHSIASLDPTRYYPVVILPSDMPEGMLSAELARRGIEYHFAPLGILRRKYLSARRILPLARDFIRGVAHVRSLARRRNAKLIYVNTIVVPSGAIGGWLARVPVLWHIREILSMPRPVRWTLYRTLGLCSDRIICISRAVRDSLVREAPDLEGKCEVLYNAVSLAPRTRNRPLVGIREELGIPDGAPLIGTVGRITHWKGQEILAQAAKVVLQKHPDAHFIAVGSYFADEVHYLRRLEAFVAESGLSDRFHFAGYRENVTELYSAFDIFVLASRKPEPFGRVTVEAMMEARPVIATNHGGTCELIQDGVTGLLVPPSDPESLAAALDRLLSDRELRLRLGRSAAIYAHANFSLRRYKKEICGIIEQLVAAA